MGAAAVAAAPPVAKRPNFVFLFLDDMRLDDMVALPRVSNLITARGTNVTNFFVNTPVCCPSRATLFSGRYPHNNRKTSITTVVPCCMHMDLLYGHVASASAAPNPKEECSNPGFWRSTFATHLQDAGFNMGIFGKAYHMGDDAPCGFAGNGYGPHNDTVLTNTSAPFMLPGWDRHFVYCYPLDQYFWNRYNDQGVLVGTRGAPEDYATGERAVCSCFCSFCFCCCCRGVPHLQRPLACPQRCLGTKRCSGCAPMPSQRRSAMAAAPSLLMSRFIRRTARRRRRRGTTSRGRLNGG